MWDRRVVLYPQCLSPPRAITESWLQFKEIGFPLVMVQNRYELGERQTVLADNKLIPHFHYRVKDA